MQKRYAFLLILTCHGCCAPVRSPREFHVRNSAAWFHSEDDREIRIEEFKLLQSETALRRLPGETVVNFMYSWDAMHFEKFASLVLTPSGSYQIVDGDEEVANFLLDRMGTIRSTSDVNDFLELFAVMRGYEHVDKKPEIVDVRIRRGETIPKQDYTMLVRETDRHWIVDVSLKTNRISGSIHRYHFNFPKSGKYFFDVEQGTLQFISDFVR